MAKAAGGKIDGPDRPGPGPGVTIRRAVAGDAGALAACIDAAYRPARDRGLALPAVAEGVEEDIREHRVWVAEQGGIVGGLVLSVDGPVAHLVNVAVDPNHGGRGIGRRLIEIAVKAAREDGARRIDLATHVGLPENVALYRRLGWQETGRTGNKVMMTRPLG